MIETATTTTRGSRQPAETRELVLSTAEKFFLEKGFRATSLQEIADAAGRTTGSIYSSFSGKDELFLEVWRWRASKQEAIWRKELHEAATSDGDAREIIVHALLLAMPEPAWQAVQFEFISFAARDESLSREAAEIFRHAAEVWKEILSEFGEASPLATDRVGPILIALARGLAATWFVDPDEYDPSLFGDAAALLLGLPAPVKPRPAPAG